MYKIVELDIDGTLTGDTRIEEIAMVSLPAIEQNFIYFAKEDSFIVPQAVASKACKARKYKEEKGTSCGTPVGWTRSSQLCDRKPITLETVKRMYSFFSRHSVNNKPGLTYEKGCHAIMWDAWGGDPGFDWSKRIVERHEDMDIDVSALPEYVDYATGDTENDMLIEEVGFIEKRQDESQDDYVSRCIEWHIKNKGWDRDQAAAVCYKQAEEAFAAGQKVSFDYDGVLTKARGVGLLLYEINSGSDVYIVSSSFNKKLIERFAEKYGIHSSKIFATGSNPAKIRKIKQLRIDKHYDDDEKVISELGRVGMDFNCSCLDEFAIEPNPCWKGYEPIGLKDDGSPNCVPIEASKEDFKYVGLIDDSPVFSTKEEAIEYGRDMKGCESYHVHTDEEGNEVYMPCELHPEPVEEQAFGVEEYSDEEKEAIKYLYWLKENDSQKFEAVVGSLRGKTKDEIIALNHAKPTNYFQYQRKLDGSPDRDFCMSIEDRYFRRLEIDLLKDVNREFGHQQQSYSKWLYKGGPNCVHAFRKFIVQGEVFADQGWAEGLAGMAPKEMPNNGYYNEETKRKSEVAYIVSQKMSKEQFKSEDEKRMIYSPLMIPGILIPRLDDNNEKYFVKFKPNAIEKMQQLYMLEKRMDKTNYEHSNKKLPSVVMVESWIVSGEKDKAYELGFKRDDIPNGTWMGGFKVMDTPDGDTLWNDYIKTGKLKGFSVEGDFLMKFSRLKTDDYLLSEIINILNKIEN